LTTDVVLLCHDQVRKLIVRDSSIVGQVVPIVMNTAPVSIGRGGSVIERGSHTILVVVPIGFNCFLGAEILIVQVQLLT